MGIKVCGHDSRELPTDPDVCCIGIMVGHRFENALPPWRVLHRHQGREEDTDPFQQRRGLKGSNSPEKVGDFASPRMFLLKPQGNDTESVHLHCVVCTSMDCCHPNMHLVALKHPTDRCLLPLALWSLGLSMGMISSFAVCPKVPWRRLSLLALNQGLKCGFKCQSALKTSGSPWRVCGDHAHSVEICFTENEPESW